MSDLKKAYEISIWKDVLESVTENDQTIQKFVEKRVAVIGSDKMETQCRAIVPKFKKKVNGEKELTFQLYSSYIDSITGEEVHNPFTDLLDNETKLKLKYRGKWYDMVVKDVQEDSSTKTKTYTAIDQFVVELSKNGYNLVLDTSLMNNTGNLIELAESILKDTDWEVDKQSDIPLQYLEEQLIQLKTKNDEGKEIDVYAFFSSCKNQPNYFQYVTELGELNSENVYDKTIQTYVDMQLENLSYTTDTKAVKYGFSYPEGFTFVELTNLRAKRLVYTHKSKLNPALNKIVYSYNEGEIEGYTTTELITPNLITNFVTNNTFKSTSGWTGSCLAEVQEDFKNSENRAEVEVIAIDSKGNSLIEDFKQGKFVGKTYTPHLKVKFQSEHSVLVNSGFYDNRSIIKNLAPGQRFVLMYKETNSQHKTFQTRIGIGNYSVKEGRYTSLKDTFLDFNSIPVFKNGYAFIHASVPNNYNIIDEKTYQKQKVQIFITSKAGNEFLFEDFQIFPEVYNNETLLTPKESSLEAIEKNTYYYYSTKDNSNVPSAAGYRASEQEYKYCSITNQPANYTPDYTTDKILSVNIKQSNYFNAIQSLCETFEVWADFDVEHDEEGKIRSKKIIFKENLENPNYLGFKYGVNLKSTKRTIDSKAIVTKLIVPDNTNEFAKNGFCSIARAGANTSGENFILDFSYYYNFGKLDQNQMHELLYRPKEGFETDNLQGYYIQLSNINSELNAYVDRYTELSAPLAQAEADLQVAESGREAAKESYEEISESFVNLAGYDHTAITVDDTEETTRRLEQVENSTTLTRYLTELSEYYSAWQKYEKEVENAADRYDRYKELNNSLLERIEQKNIKKEELNKLFYQRFYRFIQEGTWKDDKYIEDDKYYSDAVSTAANSALPKVTYTFNVIDVAQLPGYENFEFELGDKTWVEDPDLFGNGREEVVITEITYELEEPDKTSIKIQNHKDQFSSLFQKITATTQSVQYAAGQWNKASDFASANPVDQAAFLQKALFDAEMKLQNAGEQSVVWDKTGITVTDMLSPNEQIRIIGGAIMLRNPDGDGLGWTTAITAKGINAKIITTGELNTGKITIMYGDEPYFRWDAFGITAYHFNSQKALEGGYLYGLDTTKGVRFDRFGIYGYDGVDGISWHPESFQDIKESAMFALTWEGLYLSLGKGRYANYISYDKENKTFDVEYFERPVTHESVTQLGIVTNYLYNTWVKDRTSDKYGLPYYDPKSPEQPFVKVMAIGSKDGEQFVIYDDGTLVANRVKLTGGVEWVPNASPTRTVYGTIELINSPPKDDWYYSSIPDNDPGESKPLNERWHNKRTEDDQLYCRTDTAGAYWTGPFYVEGKQGDPGPKGDSSTFVRAFLKTADANQPDVPTDIVENPEEGWVLNEIQGDSSQPYVWTSTGNRTENTDGEITYENWTTPELWRAWTSDNINQKSYATFLTLTGGKESALEYQDGKLFIKAEFLQANNILVKDEDGQVVFSAGVNSDDELVRMGGFAVRRAGFGDTSRYPTGSGIWFESNPGENGFYINCTNYADTTKYFQVCTDGTVRAPYGVIGGCTIDSAGMYSGSGNTTAGIGVQGQRWAFWAGGDINDTGSAKFVVGHDGSFTAKMGSISNWGITDNYLGTYGDVAATVFMSQNGQGAHVNNIGAVSCVFYSKGNFAVDTNGILYATNGHFSGIVNAVNSTFSGTVYANDGSFYGTVDATGGSFSSLALKNFMTINTVNGVSTGIRIEAWNDGAIIGPAQGSSLIGANSYGIKLGSDIYGGIFMKAGAVELEMSNTGSGVKGNLRGTWQTSAAITVVSDLNKKHSIEDMPSQYTIFFDNINPIRYKYNDGTSNRYHTGFVAQEIADALQIANINTQDFAGLTVCDQGTENELWALRYEEFVSLNTWQIQKLKPRMTAAEQEILQLKSEVESLRAELENLKNS